MLRIRSVTVLDWAIVAFTLALGLWGYRQGLIVGALTLVGFARRALSLGSRLGPLVLSQGADSPYAPLCAALGALLVGALVAVDAGGLRAGAAAAADPAAASLHRADGAGGAALIAAVALGLAWVFGAVALHAPGTDAAARRRPELGDPAQPQPSAAAERRPVLNVLDRVDPAPSIIGPATPVDAARPDDRRRPRRAARRRLGGAGAEHRLRARHRGLGLGGAAGPDRHQRPRRRRRRRHHGDDPERGRAATRRRSTTSPQNDLALLRVGRASCRPLPISSRTPSRAPSAAVLGYPGERALHGDAGAGRRDPRRRSARTPTAAGRSSARSPRCAATCAAATPAGRWSTLAGGSSGSSSRRRPAGRPAASRSRPRRSEEALARLRRRRSTPAPAPELSEIAGPCTYVQ